MRSDTPNSLYVPFPTVHTTAAVGDSITLQSAQARRSRSGPVTASAGPQESRTFSRRINVEIR
jgi:hypothetical protein